jgi:hypothetical protein
MIWKGAHELKGRSINISHVALVVMATLRYQKYPKYPSRQYLVDLEAIDENTTDYDQGMERKKFYRKNGYRHRDSGYPIPLL